MSGVSDPQMRGNHNKMEIKDIANEGVSDPQMKGNHNTVLA